MTRAAFEAERHRRPLRIDQAFGPSLDLAQGAAAADAYFVRERGTQTR
jgi:hypothetical protein